MFNLHHLTHVLGPDRRPESLLAAILRVPFVDLLTTMTQPELPLTVHEYDEWGDPSDPAALQLVSVSQRNLFVAQPPNVHMSYLHVRSTHRSASLRFHLLFISEVHQEPFVCSVGSL